MGRRGPPRKPTSVLEARGSWLAPIRRSKQPIAEMGSPLCPKWLSKNAKAIWKRLTGHLEKMNVLAVIDQGALARYCQLYDDWREAVLFVRKHGTTYECVSPLGRVTEYKQWPQVNQASKLVDQLLRLEQQFGLTPSARASLVAEPGPAPKKKTKGKKKRNHLNLGSASA